MTSNPFLTPSPLPYELPPFADISIEHLEPAFAYGMAEQLAEVAAIVADPAPATVENTLEPLERSGRVLDRVSRVFGLLTSADTTPELQALESELSPRLAAHHDAILLDPGLFARIDDLNQRRQADDLDPEELRLVERYHLDFVRAGAALDADGRDRLRAINAELASCETEFGNRLLADTNDSALMCRDAAELDGLSPDEVAAAAAAARRRGQDGYLVTLVLPSVQPALARLRDRTVRRRLLQASLDRGSRGNENDTQRLVLQVVLLRAERAALLGYATHSDYVLADRTAGSNQALDALLDQIVPAAAANVTAEQTELLELARKAGQDEVAAWDWPYWAEQLEQGTSAVDSAALRPYTELHRTLVDGVFAAAERLYGITVTRRQDLIAHHRDAMVWEVRESDGSELGLFVGDFFTRDSKRGGAWAQSLVLQSRLLDQRPVVVNTLNIVPPSDGEPALISADNVRTLFHEFGHALHALFSAVRYPRLAGTAVARDFVEYPSQVNEMWLRDPDVMRGYLRHVGSGEVLPDDQREQLRAAATGKQGYETAAYLAAAWIDLAWHRLTAAQAREVTDVAGFERQALAEVGLALDAVPPRYRSTYFNHIFAGGYSAGYYSYIWSEVLDADTVEWFTAYEGPLREAGQVFRDALLSRGGSGPEVGYFEAFRGRQPEIEPLLRRRGLTTSAPVAK